MIAGPVTRTSTGTGTGTGLSRLHEEIVSHDKELERLVAESAPALMASQGIATLTIAEMLILVGNNPTRIRSEAAFASSEVLAPFLHPAAKPTASV